MSAILLRRLRRNPKLTAALADRLAVLATKIVELARISRESALEDKARKEIVRIQQERLEILVSTLKAKLQHADLLIEATAKHQAAAERLLDKLAAIAELEVLSHSKEQRH